LKTVPTRGLEIIGIINSSKNKNSAGYFEIASKI